MRKAIPLLLLSVVLSACGATPVAAPGGPAGPGAATDRNYSAAVLKDAPAAYWRMGEASGTTMIDATKNHNDGTYAGSVALGQPGALAGGSATAVAFDGRTAGARVASSRSLKVNWITIELWVEKTTESGAGVYVAKNVAGGGGVGSSWFQLLNNGTSGRLEFRVTGDVDPVLVSATALAVNTWYYVVATYDGMAA